MSTAGQKARVLADLVGEDRGDGDGGLVDAAPTHQRVVLTLKKFDVLDDGARELAEIVTQEFVDEALIRQVVERPGETTKEERPFHS